MVTSKIGAQQTENYTKISRNDFPDNFVFGTGTSAYQHEGGAKKGGRGPSIWDDFTLNTPHKILDKSNGNDAADMYTNYKKDIEMMKKLGFDAYRFSISWSRILPRGKICHGINREGIKFYKDIIDTLSHHGIEPYVTLFHWDLPLELEKEYRGFLSKEIVHDFRDFAELCFWEFGHKVKKWITLNEPWTYCFRGYVECGFPPGKVSSPGSGSIPINKTKTQNNTNLIVSDQFHKISSRHRYWITIIENNLNFVTHGTFHDQIIRMSSSTFKVTHDVHTKTISSYSNKSKVINHGSESMPNSVKDVYSAAKNMLLAHAAAVHSYRTKFQEHQKGQIGITLVSHWFEPLHNTVADRRAVKRALDFMLGWFLEPVLSGHYPQNMMDFVPHKNLKPFSKDESKLLKGSIDFLGLNYYTTYYATEHDPNDHSGKGYNHDQHVDTRPDKGKKLIGEKTDLKWLYIVPWGIYKLLKYINRTYNNITYKLPPIYINENGVDEKDNPELSVYEACRDHTRISYHQSHLGNILKAIKEKVNVKGYFVWSWCDNFEWADGYTARFGIIYVDYEDNFKRHLKLSARWFSKFLLRNHVKHKLIKN